MIKKICDNCKKEYEARNSVQQKNKHFFCCLDCMYKYKRKNDLREFSVDDNYFNIITPQNCWLLGLLASDGSIIKDRFVKISQSGKEGLRCINYIKREIKFTGPIFSYLPKTSNNKVYALTINSKRLVNKLKDYNVIQNKTKIFKIPQIILNNENFLKWFLIGYIDGDGCIGIYSNGGIAKKKNYLTIGLVCNGLMIKQLKQSLNQFKNTTVVKKSGTLFEIRFDNKKGYVFGKWLYSNIEIQNIYQSYKYKKFKSYKENIVNTTNWYKYDKLYEKLKNDLKNNGFTSIRKWSKMYKVSNSWVIKNKKAILKDLKNAT